MKENTESIYDRLLKAEKDKKRHARELALRAIGLSEEFFEEGTIGIDKVTCKGVECKLCIEECPTNALYWGEAMVKIEHDLCIYCGACVLSCIVDNCIKIVRKRKNGEVEQFSTPQEVTLLLNRRAMERRGKKLQAILTELANSK